MVQGSIRRLTHGPGLVAIRDVRGYGDLVGTWRWSSERHSDALPRNSSSVPGRDPLYEIRQDPLYEIRQDQLYDRLLKFTN
eukprot:SAG31_NODE_265_length_18823_cov_5.968863_8_plen_81_part_00